MKSLIIFVVVFAALKNAQAFNPFNPKDPEIMVHIDPCAEKTGVDGSIFKSAEPIDKEKIKELYKDHKYRCFSRCIMEGLNFLKDGEFNLDVMKSKLQLSDEDFEKAKDCVEKNKQEDECDRAVEVKMCVKKLLKNHD